MHIPVDDEHEEDDVDDEYAEDENEVEWSGFMWERNEIHRYHGNIKVQ